MFVGFSSTSKQFFVTPARCPTIQLNSGTFFLETQVPPVKGSVLQDCPGPTSDAKGKSRCLCADGLAVDRRFP